ARASLLGNYIMALAWLLFWLAAGGLAFPSRFEPMVARLMGLRQPTAWEKRLLETVWGRVTARAGIASNSYTLWVQDSSEINASASLGTTIAITRGALSQLSPEELEAVLAHELRSEEHTSELQSRENLVCGLLLVKKKCKKNC